MDRGGGELAGALLWLEPIRGQAHAIFRDVADVPVRVLDGVVRKLLSLAIAHRSLEVRR